MPNGQPHDHPLTDILVHSAPVYGEEADNLIREIAELCSHRELYEWWEREIGWFGNDPSVVHKARVQLELLLRRAKMAVGKWKLNDERLRRKTRPILGHDGSITAYTYLSLASENVRFW